MSLPTTQSYAGAGKTEKSGANIRDGVELPSGCEAGLGVRIRRMGDVDVGRVRELRSVVRWPTEPSSFELLRRTREARWSVAEARDGTLAGMVGVVPLGKVGVLCHLAVHESYRGRGVGAGLTLWAVAYLRSRSAGMIRLYTTPQAEGLYRSAGFEPVAPRVVYRLEGAAKGPPVSAKKYRVESLEAAGLSEVCGVDYWSYEADRSSLIKEILGLHPGGGLVARDSSGRVGGYLIKCSTPEATRIGPFMASTPGVARLLLSETLKGGYGSPVEATVTGRPEEPAHELFTEFGFLGRKDRLRMELGECTGQNPGLRSYSTTPYLAT